MPKPKLLDRDGNHMEGHGKAVYHAPAGVPDAAPLPSSVDVYSYFAAHGHLGGGSPHVMLLTVIRNGAVDKKPVPMGFGITADDAERLAANLQTAAKRAREVAQVLAKKGGAA